MLKHIEIQGAVDKLKMCFPDTQPSKDIMLTKNI